MSTTKHVYNYLHSRVLYQLIIFALVTAAMFSIVVYDVIENNVNLLWIIFGAILGVVVGFSAGRMFAIKWHPDTQKVIMGTDRMGFVVLFVYIVFRIFGEKFFGQFIHGMTLSVFTFSMLGGITIGRLFSMYRNIARVLREQKIIL